MTDNAFLADHLERTGRIVERVGGEAWKLVPVEPTEAMLEAAMDESGQRVEEYTAPRESGVPTESDMSAEDAAYINGQIKESFADTYRAMLSTAPVSERIPPEDAAIPELSPHAEWTDIVDYIETLKSRIGAAEARVAELEAALAAKEKWALADAAQFAFDQTCDHPELQGNWNEACEHIERGLRALAAKEKDDA